MDKKFDVIIIGAGPAGLFAAETLSKNNKKVLIIDKGRDIKERVCPNDSITKFCTLCDPCNIYSGLGGAGGKSDGKLIFNPYIGVDLTKFMKGKTEDEKEALAYRYINYVDSLFVACGVSKEYIHEEGDVKEYKSAVEKLSTKAISFGMTFRPSNQKHIGSNKLVDVINNFKKILVDKGVEFLLRTEVEDLIVNKNKVEGVIVKKSNAKIIADNVIIAVGRGGESWFLKIARKHGINLDYLPVDIGVRVETKYEIMEPVTKINYDSKIYIRTSSDDLVRTFCVNPHGFVVRENYDDYSLVNGHAEKGGRLSPNTNFALLCRVELTKPAVDTHAYAMHIAKTTCFLSGNHNKPIIQRLKDFQNDKRSDENRIGKCFTKPTMVDVVPAAFGKAYPHDIVKNLKEAIDKLNNLCPGLSEGNNTLLYGPEIKFQSMRGKIDGNFMSEIGGLYLSGDGCGLSGSIVSAAVTGILAAEGILQNSQ